MSQYQYTISGFEYIPIYVESNKLIGLYDLMLRWNCDSALKIAHFIHNRKATFYFHGNPIGKNHNSLETILCFKLDTLRKNYESYLQIFNKFFLLKSEVFEAEKEESWFTFIDSEACIENDRICTKENAPRVARNVICALCSYDKSVYDIRHHIGVFTSNPQNKGKWLSAIEENAIKLPIVSVETLEVNYLKEYQGEDFTTVGDFEIAREYITSHPPKNTQETNMLIIKLKHEFQLSHKEIGQLVYSDWDSIGHEALTKRITRALQGYSKYFLE